MTGLPWDKSGSDPLGDLMSHADASALAFNRSVGRAVLKLSPNVMAYVMCQLDHTHSLATCIPSNIQLGEE